MLGSPTVYNPIIASKCDSSHEGRNQNILFITLRIFTFLFDSFPRRIIILCNVSMMFYFVVLLVRVTFVSRTIYGIVSYLITRKESIITKIRKITLEYPREIYLMSDAILAMRWDIFLEIVPRIKGRRTTRKDIMLTLQRMMNLPGREPKETVKILLAMKNMF